MGPPAGQKSTEELQRIGLARLRQLGASYIVGVDEVGLGSWAGPVTVCAAVARANWSHPLVKDSKKMSKDAHIAVATRILLPPAIPFHTIRNLSNLDIDKMGVTHARDALVLDVVARARKHFPHALAVMDGNMLPRGLHNAICFPKADDLSGAVSAASILAKRDRDELMRFMAEEYEGYGFETNAGYRSPKHLEGLERWGPTPIHRMSYRNIQEYVKKGSPTTRPPGTLGAWQPSRSEMPGSTSSSKR